MVRGLLLALSLAALLGGSAVAGERPLLAVLDFDGSQAKLSDAEVVELTEIARKEAFDRLGSRYDIITRENLVDLLKSHGKTLERCQGECETETGRLIGADVVVSGAVRKVFGGYSLSLKAHSTDPPKVLGIEKGKTKDREEIPDLVVGAATKLYSGLRESVPPTTVPTGRGAQGSKEATKGDDDWPLEAADTSFVTFVSDPPGAEVWVDGTSLGTPAPGKKGITRRVRRGKREVTMALTLYKPKTVPWDVRAGRETVELKLDPNFAELTVESSPSGLPVFIDGDQVGTTPIHNLRLIKGLHDLRIADPCHFEWTDSVTAVPEQALRRSPELKPKMAAVEVDVKFGGDEIPAVLSVDGKEYGTTPGPYKVPLCSKKVRVVPEDDALNSWEHALDLEHLAVWRATAEVSDQASIMRAISEEAAYEQLVEKRIGWLEISSSFRSIGSVPGARLQATIQPSFLSRSLFVGAEIGWTKSGRSATDFDPVLPESVDEVFRATQTLHYTAGFQRWFSWGGAFIGGLYGTQWSENRFRTGSNETFPAQEDEFSQFGAELGLRWFFVDTMSVQASYATFDKGDDWVCIGLGTNMSAYSMQHSERASRESMAAILLVAAPVVAGVFALQP